MKKSVFLLFIVFVFSGFRYAATAQTAVQTVRGQVLDNQTKSPLTGAVIVLTDSMRINAIADDNGNFRLKNVTIGRHNVRVTMLGYRERQIPVVVTAGKEVVLAVEMEELVVEGKEVVIVADKTKPNNEMVTVSSRPFSIEETQRYAGSLGDPARMASNFAGVQANNDSRNDIIIRGNSPQGVLWRFNGMDIPSPNHFSSFGSTGGPVSILNNNVLDNSDFMTGAFPSEYGNALAGVFDLRMRNGNNEKHEFMGQIGFNGFEVGAEGPLSKNKQASYLLNYRYSTLGLFNRLGINFGTGTAIPEYQDLSYKIHLPTVKAGVFSVFGIAGKSYSELLYSKRDTTLKDLFTIAGFDTYYGTKMAATGITHAYNFGSTAYGKLTIGTTYAATEGRQDSVSPITNEPVKYYGQLFSQGKLMGNYTLTKKFNTRNTLKSGVFFENIRFTLKDSVRESPVFFRTLRNSSGDAALVQAYSQWQHKFTDHITLNSGVHYQQLLLNNSYAVEPRIGLKVELPKNQSLSLGSGLHSQMQPIFMYFNRTFNADGSYTETNRNLGFTRSIHGVLAYDKNFGGNVRVKAETYYQHLFDVIVTRHPSVYSGVNEGADFNVTNIDSLVNEGTGKNYGVELTIEKFYSKGYYYLITGSLFESKYKGSDGVERNTAFNSKYTLNVLGGKEFQLGEKNVLSLNSKVVLAGGKRYIPIDEAQSLLSGQPAYIYDDAYNFKYDDYFRLDLKIAFTRNGKHITQQWAVDMQNLTNRDNVFLEVFDPYTRTVKTNYQMGLFIVPMYRITF